MMSSTDQLETSTSSSLGHDTPSSLVKQKTIFIAYLLGVPIGFTGAHHFYLGNYSLGLTYLMTGGLAGLGWIVDWLRMRSLVADANRANEARWRWENEQAGFRDENVLEYMTDNRRLMDCYLMVFITGVFGSHQFYLKRYKWAIAYMLTAGLGGAGWIMDWFRLPHLHSRYKANLKAKSEGVEQIEKYYRLDDVYACCITLGVFGFHRFYLQEYGWGLVYLFTFGLFGWGWLVDMIRMKWLVEKKNRHIWQDEENRRLLSGHNNPTRYTNDYSGDSAYVTSTTTPDKNGSQQIAPPAAVMHGYYFPAQSHLSAQAPTYQNMEQHPQGIPGSDEQPGKAVPPPPYTPMADAASALPEVMTSPADTTVPNENSNSDSVKLPIPDAPPYEDLSD